MHRVPDHILQQLQSLVQNTSPRALTQRLKSASNQELWHWVQRVAPAHFTSVASTVHWILAGSPDFVCAHGQLKPWAARDHKLGFCGDAGKCQCFRQQMSDLGSQKDMAQVATQRVATWRRKYGHDNVSQCEAVKTKRRETMRQRDYGRLHERLQQHHQQQGLEHVISRLAGVVTPEFTPDQYAGCFRKNCYSWRCCTCGRVFSDHVDYGRVPRCPRCFPSHVSLGQIQVEQLLEDLQIPWIRGDKSVLLGQELDIYIPTLRLAIEFNGLYWHSDRFKDRYYHCDKFLNCQKSGIRLIQIWEDDWINKQSIVVARLKSVLGISARVPARQCQLDESVSGSESFEFLQRHHLQGPATASVVLGLKLQGQLVAVMSFSPSRYASAPWELIRYASVGTVVGGAGKLFSAFQKKYQPTSVVSYANRCWSWGGLYQALGFTETTAHQRNAGYWYVRNGRRYHRSNFTKKQLIQQGMTADQTEIQIMKSLGYLVIWDAGNSRWLWSSSEKN